MFTYLFATIKSVFWYWVFDTMSAVKTFGGVKMNPEKVFSEILSSHPELIESAIEIVTRLLHESCSEN